MRRLFPLVFLITLAASACADSVPVDADGPQIYQAVCARCHGGDLSGGVGPALDAGSPSGDQPVEYFLQTVERGLGRMPSYQGTLTEAQIERVVGYILDQQGR